MNCLIYLQVLKDASPTEDDRECLIQVDGLLQGLKGRLGSKTGTMPQRKNWLVKDFHFKYLNKILYRPPYKNKHLLFKI